MTWKPRYYPKNINGGAKCIMREAVGYTDKPRTNRGRAQGALLVSGIWSHVSEWAGFSYDESELVAAEVRVAKLKPFNPVGMISQAPALRSDYKGTNPAGGRKCPSSAIGAAMRITGDWTSQLKGHMGDIRVRFSIGENRVGLRPEREGAR